MGKGTRRKGKKKPSAAKRIRPCDFYSKDHAAWLKRQEEPQVVNNKGFKPKKLAPGEERVPWRLKFMMECQELMNLSKAERKQKLLEKYNKKSPYLEKLEKHEQERRAELEKKHQIELVDDEKQLTKKEQLFKGIHEEKLKALRSVVDADGRDRGVANDTALLDSMSKKQKEKLRLKERERRLKMKKLEKKQKAQEKIHKSTDFVKFGDVAQAPPTLPTIKVNKHSASEMAIEMGLVKQDDDDDVVVEHTTQEQAKSIDQQDIPANDLSEPVVPSEKLLQQLAIEEETEKRLLKHQKRAEAGKEGVKTFDTLDQSKLAHDAAEREFLLNQLRTTAIENYKKAKKQKMLRSKLEHRTKELRASRTQN